MYKLIELTEENKREISLFADTRFANGKKGVFFGNLESLRASISFISPEAPEEIRDSFGNYVTVIFDAVYITFPEVITLDRANALYKDLLAFGIEDEVLEKYSGIIE